MSRELELVGLVAADGLAGPRKAPPGAGPKHADAHTECLNCGATLHGRFCAVCGQVADDHHRSIFHLAWEAIEGLTHLDGHLAKTLPPLFFNPGALARDHFEGRRQRHVPPFRLFLVSLLLFMLALEAVMHGAAHVGGPAATMEVDDGQGHKTRVAAPTPEQLARWSENKTSGEEIRREMKLPPGVGTLGETPADVLPAALAPLPGLASPEAPQTPALPSASAWDSLPRKDKTGGTEAAGNWFEERLKKAVANPEYYKTVVFEWAHRLAILLLPIFALQLTILFFYKRKYFIYDHLVVSTQFLSFVFLISALAWILPGPVRGVAVGIASVWTPINLFMLLRGAYGSGWLGAGLKTAYLWVSTCVVFLLMLLGLLALGLQQI